MLISPPSAMMNKSAKKSQGARTLSKLNHCIDIFDRWHLIFHRDTRTPGGIGLEISAKNNFLNKYEILHNTLLQIQFSDKYVWCFFHHISLLRIRNYVEMRSFDAHDLYLALQKILKRCVILGEKSKSY